MMRKFANLALLAALPLALGQTPATPVMTKDFSTLSTYTGTLAISGIFGVGQDTADTLVMFWLLINADPACTSANLANLTLPNACGIHIHSGTSCASPGGHFYDNITVAIDPWSSIKYTFAAFSVGSGVRVKTGKTISDIAGKVVVVHDSLGVKVSCAPLEALTYSASKYAVSSLVTYPGYAGTLKVSGSASIVQVVGSGSVQEIEVIGYSLTGADPLCLGTSTATLLAVSPNACGVHIHNGTSCTTASLVGGHWFNTNVTSGMDFWSGVSYASTAGGVALGNTPPVATGYNISDVNGKTFVIHDSTGTRVACGIVTPDSGGAMASGAKELYASPLLLLFAFVAQLF